MLRPMAALNSTAAQIDLAMPIPMPLLFSARLPVGHAVMYLVAIHNKSTMKCKHSKIDDEDANLPP